jgi:hypothetical protein
MNTSHIGFFIGTSGTFITDVEARSSCTESFRGNRRSKDSKMVSSSIAVTTTNISLSSISRNGHWKLELEFNSIGHEWSDGFIVGGFNTKQITGFVICPTLSSTI